MYVRDYHESYSSLKSQAALMWNLFSKNENEHPTRQQLH